MSFAGKSKCDLSSLGSVAGEQLSHFDFGAPLSGEAGHFEHVLDSPFSVLVVRFAILGSLFAVLDSRFSGHYIASRAPSPLHKKFPGTSRRIVSGHWLCERRPSFCVGGAPHNRMQS